MEMLEIVWHIVTAGAVITLYQYVLDWGLKTERTPFQRKALLGSWGAFVVLSLVVVLL